jgi:hypothetical protein
MKFTAVVPFAVSKHHQIVPHGEMARRSVNF